MVPSVHGNANKIITDSIASWLLNKYTYINRQHFNEALAHLEPKRFPQLTSSQVFHMPSCSIGQYWYMKNVWRSFVVRGTCLASAYVNFSFLIRSLSFLACPDRIHVGGSAIRSDRRSSWMVQSFKRNSYELLTFFFLRVKHKLNFLLLWYLACLAFVLFLEKWTFLLRFSLPSALY